jgi:hypothetical protein
LWRRWFVDGNLYADSSTYTNAFKYAIYQPYARTRTRTYARTRTRTRTYACASSS